MTLQLGVQCPFCAKEREKKAEQGILTQKYYFSSVELLKSHMLRCGDECYPAYCAVDQCNFKFKSNRRSYYRHLKDHATLFHAGILRPSNDIAGGDNPAETQDDFGADDDLLRNENDPETITDIQRSLERLAFFPIRHDPEDHGMLPSITASSTATMLQSILLKMRAHNNCTIELVDQTAKSIHDAVYNVCSVVTENLLAKAIKQNFIDKQSADELAAQSRVFATKFLECIRPLTSEYGRRKFLEDEGFLVEPTSVPIRERLVSKLKGKGITEEVVKSDSMQIIDLKATLEIWFSDPDISKHLILQSTVQPTDYASTPVNGAFMKRIYEVLGEDFIAIEIHADDIDPCNPLSSHKKAYELCIVSGCVKNMEEMYQSANVCKFLVAVGHSSDMEIDDYELLHEEIVKQFDKCDKITVKFPDEEKEMPVVFFYFNGDYLAVKKHLRWNIIWHNDFSCPICEVSYEEMVTNFRANPAYRRKIDTHNDYARRAKLEDNLAFRGVRGIPKLVDSRISPMRFFHPVTNMNIEIMHLWQEGTGKMLMYQILRVMIYEENFFTLDALNMFIDRLPIGIVDKHLRLATMNISSNKELNSNGNLKPLGFAQNAAETMFFIRMFGFIIAQLVGEHEDNIFLVQRMVRSRIFELWRELAKFQSFLFAPKMPYTEVAKLGMRYERLFKMVDENVEKLQKVFKNHAGVHLEEFVTERGMLTYYKANSYEAIYANMKSYCHFNRNHTNVPYSTARSHEYSRAISLLESKHKKDRYICNSYKRVKVSQLTGSQKIQERLNVDESDLLCVSKKMVFGGTTYQNGMLVVLTYQNRFPIFGSICCIVYCLKKWVLVVRTMSTIKFDHDLQMFEIENSENFEVIDVVDLHDYHPCDAYPFGNRIVASLPYRIF